MGCLFQNARGAFRPEVRSDSWSGQNGILAFETKDEGMNFYLGYGGSGGCWYQQEPGRGCGGSTFPGARTGYSKNKKYQKVCAKARITLRIAATTPGRGT